MRNSCSQKVIKKIKRAQTYSLNLLHQTLDICNKLEAEISLKILKLNLHSALNLISGFFYNPYTNKLLMVR